MANRRSERLNEQLRREISDILRHDVRDPRVGIPTVTRVEVTPDLWMARVFVRVGGADAERASALEGLEAASAFIRRDLSARIKVRRVPELRFELDKTLEHASRIEELLREVSPGPAGAADAADAVTGEDSDDAPDDGGEGEDGE
jgi:ribosome-binding factor A